MFKLYQNPPESSTSLPAQAATKANRRAVRAWLASRHEVCSYFDTNPGRRHVLLNARREDYVNLFVRDRHAAASRGWRSAGIVCAAMWVPGNHTVARLLFPVETGPRRFAGTEAEARAVFDAKWADASGHVAHDAFWMGGTWRDVTVQ